jgi:hypothetical protein
MNSKTLERPDCGDSAHFQDRSEAPGDAGGTGAGALSTPMTESEVDMLSEAMLGGFRKCSSIRGPG